jgi:hypothetical protein
MEGEIFIKYPQNEKYFYCSLCTNNTYILDLPNKNFTQACKICPKGGKKCEGN